MSISDDKLKAIAYAVKRLEELDRAECFDPFRPDTRPTAKQLQILEDFGKVPIQIIRAGNQSGKTTTIARICAWLLKENHPYWSRPPEWGTEPLLIIICGRTSKQIEESLLRRILGYFPEGEIREIRVGNIIQKVVHKQTQNTIIFQSYENITQARERVQSYTAHFVWVDEMPASFSLFDELLRRVQAKNGYFAATFTPLVVSNEIRRFCDSVEERGLGKVYRLSMFDNPIYKDPNKQNKILAELSTLPESMRLARLEGEWLVPDNNVYYFDTETMIRELPSHYSPLWRHVEASDPALNSAHGLVILAEDPTNGTWYTVMAEYIKGIYVPDQLITTILEKTRFLNIVRRVSDSAPWFTHSAAARGVHYIIPFDKNNRRDEMIKKVQTSLGTTLFITPNCRELLEEFQTYRWSTSNEGRIIDSNDYHLLDALRYGVDNLPKFDGQTEVISWEKQLIDNHFKLKKQQAIKEKLRYKGRWPRPGLGKRWW